MLDTTGRLYESHSQNSFRKSRCGAVLALDVKNAFCTAGWNHINGTLVGKIPNYLLKVVSSYFHKKRIVIDTGGGRISLIMVPSRSHFRCFCKLFHDNDDGGRSD